MNRSSFAFFVALLIHFLLVLVFWILGTIAPEFKKPKQEDENKIKISLKDMPIKEKESGITKEKIQPPQTPMAPPMPKGSQLKEVVQQKPIKYEPKIVPKTPELNPAPKEIQKEPQPQPKREPLPPEKPYIPLLEPKKQEHNLTKQEAKPKIKPEDELLAILSQDNSAQEEKAQDVKTAAGSSINQNIKELYGDDFGKLTPGQQQYILDNQEIMRRITQQVLTRVASVNLKGNLNVNRSNVIEFYLHPNGDMTDFKFLEKSGYYILDDTTKETIEYAYSRYPRPTEKILIRYNVFYNLARY
ncbi:hypothetical protein KKG72_05075 [bacterium]|nr:hypothetical protein [bacterium]MBU1995431.1 hypothetical protein [bacterium]